ncbi:MAG: IPT/TIG domain-containing protein [Myxococcaceae bacterium]|nr:IPT/TIG domain-containing protein [Myxococcaceae bacterium]
MLTSWLCVALAGTAWLQNDNFSGSGAVNSAVSFGEYEGAAVLFTPDGGYPITVLGVDVLSVTYGGGASGEVAGYQVDVWDESGGLVDPPRLADGGRYTQKERLFVQFTTSTTAFRRVTFTNPIVLTQGRLFVSIGEMLQTSITNATIAIDSAPLKPGANWYRSLVGTFDRLDLPDGGFFNGINHNWVVRAVVEVPDVTPTVTSVMPNNGPNTTTTSVGITGSDFALTSRAFVGSNELTITNRSGSGLLVATVPAGLTPGAYPVSVQNSPTAVGVLQNAFTVTGPGGAGGGSGGTAGGAAGGLAGGSAGGTAGATAGGSAGGSTAALRLDDVTPSEGYSEEATKIVLTGDGFRDGAQVLIGSTVLDTVTVRSAAVINAEVPVGVAPGLYDVEVINLDGTRADLERGFAVIAGSRTKGAGCGCSALPIPGGVALALLLRLRRRTAVTRGPLHDAEARSRP